MKWMLLLMPMLGSCVTAPEKNCCEEPFTPPPTLVFQLQGGDYALCSNYRQDGCGVHLDGCYGAVTYECLTNVIFLGKLDDLIEDNPEKVKKPKGEKSYQ